MKPVTLTIFNSHPKGNRDIYYLETGKLKIRHLIAKRRLLFHQHILKKEGSMLIRKIYEAQKLKTVRNDFYTTVQNDKERYKVDLSDEQIEQTSKNAYKKYIDRKVHQFFLNELKSSRKTKIQDILKTLNPNDMKIPTQKYLACNELSTSEKQTLFSLRSHNFDCKANFRNQYQNMVCRLCDNEDSFEDEIHSLKCPAVVNDNELDHSIEFHHVFGSINQQIKAVKYFMPIIKRRKLLLELDSNG